MTYEELRTRIVKNINDRIASFNQIDLGVPELDYLEPKDDITDAIDKLDEMYWDTPSVIALLLSSACDDWSEEHTKQCMLGIPTRFST